MNTEEIRELVKLMQDTPGDWGDVVRGSKKHRFKTLALKYLRWLTGPGHKARFNAGGIAVSGEASVDSPIYIQISAMPYGILWRTHVRGANCWIGFDGMLSRDWYDRALALASSTAA